MRIALGCMRLSTDARRDEDAAVSTIRSALDAGIRIFDTARAYGRGEAEAGHNERLLARALAASDLAADARVVTKCGMVRDGEAWVPDGRASAVLEHARASAAALSPVPIDLLLLHAPDPRVPLSTSVRALVRAREDGLARRIGVSNVSRRELEEVAVHTEIAAVEVAIGAYDDAAVRGGVVAYCLERGIEILAHAPLGGPDRTARLARDRALAAVAARHDGAGPLDAFLAYLLAVRPEIVPVVGARRPETIARLAHASRLALADEELERLDARFPALGALRRPPRPRPAPAGGAAPEVVLMMGVPGAGKSRAAEALVARGYERLNRDTVGGSLRGIARRLEERLDEGGARLVLDNTYVGRAARNDVLRAAHARGADVRCVFFDTPLAEAQVNVVLRMLARFDRVLTPEEIAELSRADPAAIAPNALFRMTRALEPPAADEGFSSIDVVPFVREHSPTADRPGVAIARSALGEADAIVRALAGAPPGAACLLFAWRPGADADALARERAFGEQIARASGRIVEVGVCPHPAGPPICWCRPPLPGLWLDFARRHRIDPRKSTLFGGSAADRGMARALGLAFSPAAAH